MVWAIGGCIFLGIILFFFFTPGRRKITEPINVTEENSLPRKSCGTEEEHYRAMVFLASWIIEKNARGRKEKLYVATRWLKARFSASETEITSDIANALSHSTNIRSVSSWIRAFIPANEQREQVLRFILDLAFADGDIIDREYVAIARFCELIGIRLERLAKEIFNRRDRIYSDGELPAMTDLSFFRGKALHTLGLNGEASAEEIRRAYRSLVVELHPDKQAGRSDQEKESAAVRFLAVRDAYEFLMKK